MELAIQWYLEVYYTSVFCGLFFISLGGFARDILVPSLKQREAGMRLEIPGLRQVLKAELW